jgi:SAM-dependent methyltransferase
MPAHVTTRGDRFLASKVAGAFLIPQCPLCGCRENRKAFADNGCELRSCRHCGLFFIHPYPRIHQRHAQIEAGALEGIDLLDCERRHAGERLYYDRHFPWIEEECRAAKSFLDVGCGTGRLLELLSARKHMRRVGVELNPQAAEFARRSANCEILEVPFEEFRAEDPFDVISMINVFSHIPSLDALFASLRAALAPQGTVILRTSEMSAGVSRWNQLHWGVPDDLHFLGLGTIGFICRKYGFELRRHERVPFEEELFLRSRWLQIGRRNLVNRIKRVGLCLPGALTAMKSVYRAALGQRLFVSFIVLSPAKESPS